MPSILNLSQSIHRLTILGMSSTGFSDKLCSFENSPLALMTILSLTVFDLRNHDITDKSISIVQNFMNNVEYLSMSVNRISSDGGKKLIGKAEEPLQTADADEESSCHLQRIWLGGKDIEGSVFAECTCKIISSNFLTRSDTLPEFVPAMFSSSPTDNSLEPRLPSLIPEKEMLLPIMGIMQNLVLSQVMNDAMGHAIDAHDDSCFQRWLMRGVHAVGRHSDCANPVERAKSLSNLFSWLGNWNQKTRGYIFSLAVGRCTI